MPKAGYCSVCATQVWLREDGSCANGHPQSCVSRHYETEPAAPAPAMQAPQVRWAAARAWLTGLIYWFVVMSAAGAMAASGTGSTGQTGFIILAMILVLGACMYKERTGWSVGKRVGFVALAWIAVGVVSLPIMLLLAVLLGWSGNVGQIERLSTFAATLPFVIYAMWHSEWFVLSAVQPRI